MLLKSCTPPLTTTTYTKGQVLSEKQRLRELHAMASRFLSTNDCFEPESYGHEMMKSITQSIIRCLETYAPLSEDITARVL